VKSRDDLSKLTEEELESLYQKKKTEFDNKLSKNRRIRGMLSKKVEHLSKKVHDLQHEIDEIVETHPDVVKVKFDDDTGPDTNPEELKTDVQQLQKELSDLHSQKLLISNNIIEINSLISKQKEKNKELERRIEELINEANNIAKNGVSLENEELTMLFQEEEAIKDKTANLIKEIEDIRLKIHHRE
jgi:uncharacterized coiled-coil DUF342 family protein